MKTLRLLPLVLAVCLLAGCATAPAERLHQAKGAYLVALQTTDRLIDAGKITPEQAPHVTKAIQAASAALRLAETYVDGGDVFDAALDELEAALMDLAVARTKAALPAKPLALPEPSPGTSDPLAPR